MRSACDVLPFEAPAFIPTVLGGLELHGQVEEELDLLGGEVFQFEKMTISQVEWHMDSVSIE
jgi:hypothetical protein